METLARYATPQLETVSSGKVRESLRVDPSTRLIVATDRLSAFDSVLRTPIPMKGTVLTQLSEFWFSKTSDVVSNHWIRSVAPNAMLVREAEPIRVEMVVRAYLTGSAWRAYETGARRLSGTPLPEGMTRNAAFPRPIVTPTTKSESDEEITPDGIVGAGLADRSLYEQMEQASLALFERGTALLAKRGILLVDTKYEFGRIGDELVLIDEIHTPDSSRFWSSEDYAADPTSVVQWDKEYVRAWLLSHRAESGKLPNRLPDEVVAETSRRYVEILARITGEGPPPEAEAIQGALYRGMLREGLIRDGYVAIIMGSPADREHAGRIRDYLVKRGVFVDMRLVSAHKNPERLANVVREYNNALEPGAIIAVAGLSNGLGGALAANVTVPVFNCPPFKDNLDMALNVNSSLLLPSGVPAATVLRPESAAEAALRSLNLHRLRTRCAGEMAARKADLADHDRTLRQEGR